jgi:hypothetical protein
VSFTSSCGSGSALSGGKFVVSSSEPFVAKAEPDLDQDVFEARAHRVTNCGFSTQVAGDACLKGGTAVSNRR